MLFYLAIVLVFGFIGWLLGSTEGLVIGLLVGTLIAFIGSHLEK